VVVNIYQIEELNYSVVLNADVNGIANIQMKFKELIYTTRFARSVVIRLIHHIHSKYMTKKNVDGMLIPEENIMRIKNINLKDIIKEINVKQNVVRSGERKNWLKDYVDGAGRTRWFTRPYVVNVMNI